MLGAGKVKDLNNARSSLLHTLARQNKKIVEVQSSGSNFKLHLQICAALILLYDFIRFQSCQEHHWCSGNINAFQAFAMSSILVWCIFFFYFAFLSTSICFGNCFGVYFWWVRLQINCLFVVGYDH